MNKKYTLEEVRVCIESFNYKLLSTEYINNKEKLELQCPNGHKLEMSFHTFKNTGNRCAECYGNKKKDVNYIKEYIESFNYKLLSTEYKGALFKLKLQCPENHIFKMRFNNFQQGQRCPECNGGIKLTYKQVKNYIESFSYKLLSMKYKNSLTKLKIQCPKNHIFKMSYGNFRFSNNRCPICSYIDKSSKPEKEIVEFIKQFYTGKIKENDRTVCKNYWTDRKLELDIYLPELNKAIEFNGIYWHSKNIVKWRDEMKYKQCIQKGILIYILNERDWLKNKENCLKEIRDFIC